MEVNNNESFEQVELNQRYLSWMFGLIDDRKYWGDYFDSFPIKLLEHLHSITFVPMMYTDKDRGSDGMHMRELWAYYNGDFDLPDDMAAKEASVFEMIVGLAYRNETSMMHNDEFGDRTPLWFWSMIYSLGLTNTPYIGTKVDNVIQRFMERGYDADGKGSLFWIPGTEKDMRTIVIWYQMYEYLNVLYPDE